MNEPVAPLPGEVALWGALQSGTSGIMQSRHADWSHHLAGTALLILSGLSLVEFIHQGGGMWEIAGFVFFGFLALAAIRGWIKFGESARTDTRTAWFLSRERLVMSSEDGLGEAVALNDIRAANLDIAEGSPALILELNDNVITILSADARGLFRTLLELKPELESRG